MKHRETLVKWQQLTLNLRRYKPLSRIAAELNCEQMTLQRLARGEVDEPRFDLGVKLLNLHLDLFPDKHHDLLNTTNLTESYR